MMEFLEMGQYGFFVWSVFASAFVILGGIALVSHKQMKQAKIDADRLNPRRDTQKD